MRPYIDIELEAVDGRRLPKTAALVDSGADGTCLPIVWAKQLGIDVDVDCLPRPSSGVGGVTKSFACLRDVGVWVLGERLPLTVGFSAGLETILLGRRDFFDWYEILFDQRKKTFTLTPYEERPEQPTSASS